MQISFGIGGLMAQLKKKPNVQVAVDAKVKVGNEAKIRNLANKYAGVSFNYGSDNYPPWLVKSPGHQQKLRRKLASARTKPNHGVRAQQRMSKR